MATTKAVNYTAEQTTQAVADYAAGVSVEAIARALGKSVRSVVAKLSREGVYKKKEYKNKAGEAAVKKSEYADTIGNALGLSAEDADSLSNANKGALAAMVAFIQSNQ